MSMSGRDVIELVRLLEQNGIDVWIDGGWGVDALLGEQTRPHNDLDVVVQAEDLAHFLELLRVRRYHEKQQSGVRPWNFVMADGEGREIDVHVVSFDHEGNGICGPAENGEMYPAGSLDGTGMIGCQRVRCVTVEYQVKFHSGYDLDEDDIKDVLALHRRFGVGPASVGNPATDGGTNAWERGLKVRSNGWSR